jgi:hypothetical protein
LEADLCQDLVGDLGVVSGNSSQSREKLKFQEFQVIQDEALAFCGGSDDDAAPIKKVNLPLDVVAVLETVDNPRNAAVAQAESPNQVLD